MIERRHRPIASTAPQPAAANLVPTRRKLRRASGGSRRAAAQYSTRPATVRNPRCRATAAQKFTDHIGRLLFRRSATFNPPHHGDIRAGNCRCYRRLLTRCTTARTAPCRATAAQKFDDHTGRVLSRCTAVFNPPRQDAPFGAADPPSHRRSRRRAAPADRRLAYCSSTGLFWCIVVSQRALTLDY